MRLLLVLTILILASCSSEPKKTRIVTPPLVESDELENSLAEEKNITAEVDETPKEKPKSDQYKKFSDALKSKQFKIASDTASEILARDPKDTKVLNGLAVMSIEQGKLDLARMYIGKVLSHDAFNSAAYNNLGVVELKSDNLRLALVQFKKSLELDSDNKSANANLGAIYLQYRNYQNALDVLKEAVNNGDESPETYTNLGYAYKGLGRYTDAESSYEKALAKDPNNSIILLNYAALLVEHTKDTAKASKIINKLRFVAKEPAIIEKANQLSRNMGRVNGKAP